MHPTQNTCTHTCTHVHTQNLHTYLQAPAAVAADLVGPHLQVCCYGDWSRSNAHHPLAVQSRRPAAVWLD